MATMHLPLLRPGDMPSEVDPATLRSTDEFHVAVTSCHRCPLADERTNVVPGSGNMDADVVLLGTAPGRQEDVRAEPFTGAAGNVIDNALGAAGVTRDDVLLTTLVKCHPPKDRAPTTLELETCFPWYLEQLAMARPRVVVALGELPTAAMLRRRAPIARVAGLTIEVWDGLTLVPTHDPMVALRGNARAAAAIRRHVAAAVELARRVREPA